MLGFRNRLDPDGPPLCLGRGLTIHPRKTGPSYLGSSSTSGVMRWPN